jgi:hypothetical protein
MIIWVKPWVLLAIKQSQTGGLFEFIIGFTWPYHMNKHRLKTSGGRCHFSVTVTSQNWGYSIYHWGCKQFTQQVQVFSITPFKHRHHHDLFLSKSHKSRIKPIFGYSTIIFYLIDIPMSYNT